ncbi:MAG: hypothetical protein JWQ96_2810 [Segetibacter sp.]|nr:hypothetical protein [Segetibacter sp.]
MKQLIILILAAIPHLLSAQTSSGKTNATKAPTAKEQPAKEEKWEPINLWFVMLTKGANRTQDSITAVQLQAGHMANINKMSASGKLLVAGPFMEDANWRGIFIF